MTRKAEHNLRNDDTRATRPDAHHAGVGLGSADIRCAGSVLSTEDLELAGRGQIDVGNKLRARNEDRKRVERMKEEKR